MQQLSMNSARTLLSLLAGGLLVNFAGGQTIQRNLQAEAEILATDDLQSIYTEARYVSQGTQWNWEVGLAVTTLLLVYAPARPRNGLPVDPFWSETSREEVRVTASANLTWMPREHLELTASVGFFDGFGDLNSIWLAEYYRQQFEETEPTYEAPDPYGGNGVGNPRSDL